MELGGKWPVSIVATPDVAAGARLWRTAGSHRLTIVVKATFAPIHQQPMQPAPPEPIVVDDAHVEGDAARSVIAPSDLAPYLPRGEVLFVGRARSEQGAVPALSVRLGVYGPKPLVEKTLHVVGPNTRDVPVGGKTDASRDRFWGDVTVELARTWPMRNAVPVYASPASSTRCSR